MAEPSDDMAWLFLSVSTTIFWGLWGVCSTLSQDILGPGPAYTWHCVGLAICGAAAAPFVGFRLPLEAMWLSVGAGCSYSCGSLWMLNAITGGGPPGIVVTIAGLYPLAVMACNIFVFHEPASVKEAVGATIALLAIVFMSDPSAGDEVKSTHVNKTKWITISLLSLVGYAGWVLCTEGILTHQGPSAVFQALGCMVACLVQCPSFLPPRTSKLGLHSDDDKASSYWSPRFTSRDRSLSDENCSSLIQVDEVDTKRPTMLEIRGILYGMGMGAGMGAGVVTFMMACKTAPRLSPVVMIAASYPTVTLLVARVVWQQKLSYVQYIGAFAAIVASALISA